jgi:release factor glutamine methyltransferase
VSQFEQGVNQRLAGMPLAFIIGTQAFWTLELEVDSCTLIPRQDTEILVDAALELSFASNSSSSDRTKVLDLGTGTGAIALALAKERPAWNVMGVDRIAAAVALAKRNATRNGIKAAFVQSDWFSAVKGKQFNLVVSNPPYVETNSVYLTQGDLRFEPASALSSGEDGLNDIRIIIEQSLVHLHPSGWLVMEHGAAQAQAISDLLRQQGYVQIVTKTDYNDLARVTLAQKPE